MAPRVGAEGPSPWAEWYDELAQWALAAAGWLGTLDADPPAGRTVLAQQ